MIELEFRLAQIKDLEDIMNLFKAAIGAMNKIGIDQWDEIYPNKEILENDMYQKELYIGLSEGTVVSAYVLNQECDEQYVNGTWSNPDSTYCVIHRLCVNPTFQNKGIGTSTMLHIENEVRNREINYIRLDAFSLNQSAVKMYEKLGYSKVGIANWRKGKFYLMEKKI